MLSRILIFLTFVTSQAMAQEFNLTNCTEYFSPIPKSACQLFFDSDFEKVMQDLEPLSNMNPRRYPVYKVYFLQALAQQKLKNYDNAENLFARAAKGRTAVPDLHYFWGLNKLELNKNEEALSEFSEAVWYTKAKLVEPADIYLQLSKVYSSLNMPIKEKQMLDKSLALKPDNLITLSALAHKELTAGNKTAAIDYANRALAKSADNSDAKLILAKSLLLGSNRNFEQSSIEKAKQISADLLKDPTMRKQALPTHIKALIESGDLAKAGPLAEQAKKEDPDNPEIDELIKQIQLETSNQ